MIKLLSTNPLFNMCTSICKCNHKYVHIYYKCNCFVQKLLQIYIYLFIYIFIYNVINMLNDLKLFKFISLCSWNRPFWQILNPKIYKNKIIKKRKWKKKRKIKRWKVTASYKPTNPNPKYRQVVLCSHPIAALKMCRI